MTPTGLTMGSIAFGNTAGIHITGPITRTMTNKRIVRETLYGFSDQQIDLILNGLCEWHVPVRLVGTSHADLISLVKTVNAELTKRSNTLVDGLGEEVGVSFEMFRSPAILPNRGELTESRCVLEQDLLLYTRSWGSRPVINLAQQDVAGVGLVTLGALAGDLATPLDLLLTPTYTGMSRAFVAVTPPDGVATDYVLAAEDGTGWQRVAASSSVAYNANVAYTVQNAPGWSGIDLPAPLAGRYWVVLRARTDGQAELGLSEDGWTKPYAKTLVDADDYRLYLAGEFQGTGSTGLTILGHCLAADAVYLDQVLLFPLDDAACCFSCDSPAGHNLRLAMGTQQMVTGGTTFDVARYCVGDGVVGPLDDRSLLVAIGDQAGTHPKATCHVDVGYQPLHWAWAHEEPEG
jgi:hypothetical protein